MVFLVLVIALLGASATDLAGGFLSRVEIAAVIIPHEYRLIKNDLIHASQNILLGLALE